jgi:hypothetical protein
MGKGPKEPPKLEDCLLISPPPSPQAVRLYTLCPCTFSPMLTLQFSAFQEVAKMTVSATWYSLMCWKVEGSRQPLCTLAVWFVFIVLFRTGHHHELYKHTLEREMIGSRVCRGQQRLWVIQECGLHCLLLYTTKAVCHSLSPGRI